jgi:hypothetical protein
MGKLIITTTGSLHKLQLAYLGTIDLEKIAYDHLQQRLFSITDTIPFVKRLQDNLSALESLELDSSLLEQHIYKTILLIELNTLYRKLLKQLLARKLQSMKQARVDFAKYASANLPVMERLKIFHSVATKEQSLFKTPLQFNYNALLPNAYIGLQNLMQLTEEFLNDSAFMQESNLERRLANICQELSSTEAMTISIGCEGIHIPDDILEMLSAIINTFYKYLLQQEKNALEGALQIFAKIGLSAYTSAPEKLRAISKAESFIVNIENERIRFYYAELLKQTRTEVRRLRVTKPIRGEEARKQLKQQKLSQLILSSQQFSRINAQIALLKKGLKEEIVKDDLQRIDAIITQTLTSPDALNSYFTEMATDMLKGVISWAIEKRKFNAATTILISGRAWKLEEPISYMAGWSLLHDISQLIPSDEEQEQLVRLTTMLIQDFKLPVDIETQKDKGTPLFYAATADNGIMVAVFMQNGANTNHTNILGLAPLHVVARHGKINAFEALIKDDEIDLNVRDDSRVKFTNGFQFDIFVLSKFDESVISDIHRDAIILTNKNEIYFIIEGSFVKVKGKKIKHVTIKNRYGLDMATGTTPLQIQRTEATDTLLEESIKLAEIVAPNYRDNLATPLHYSCYHGHIIIVRKLLTAGANPFITDRFGMTPYDWAVAGNQVEVQEVLNKVQSRALEVRAVSPQPMQFILVKQGDTHKLHRTKRKKKDKFSTSVASMTGAEYVKFAIAITNRFKQRF